MIDPGSFRDPDGFVISNDDKILRVVNESYRSNYEHFIRSGLKNLLVSENIIIDFKESFSQKKYSSNQFKILVTEKVYPFIYPYEWSFSQLKEAAILTLELQKKCAKYGMSLKDASPYNIQFVNNSPVFIDLLSFEKTDDFNWKPIKQFYEMFFSPLLLSSRIDPHFIKLIITNIDGIPLRIVNKIIPFKTKFNPSIFLNIVLPNLFSNSGKKESKKRLDKNKHLTIINFLIESVKKIKLKGNTEWKNYNKETITEKESYVFQKEHSIKKLIKNHIEEIDELWDIGSNNGHYSRFFTKKAKNIMSFDIDWNCIEENYLINKSLNIKNIYPILLDLTNPSPGIGWNNQERKKLFDRLNTPDVINSFAIMHHIINKNIPIDYFLEFTMRSRKYIIFEYIPIDDPKCVEIFQSRDQKFILNYPTCSYIESVYNREFILIKKTLLGKTKRILYLFKRKNI